METNDKIEKLEKELAQVKKVKETFPNVKINRDIWNTERYYSEQVNNKTVEVYIHRSCGCCPDAALYARPYLKIGGTDIYSDPPSFTIGFGECCGNGVEEKEGWEDEMKEKNISKGVIEQCRKYLEENKS